MWLTSSLLVLWFIPNLANNNQIFLPFQFTLCHVLKGNKPDFHDAMNSEQSQPMYEDFLKLIGSYYKPEAIKGQLS